MLSHAGDVSMMGVTPTLKSQQSGILKRKPPRQLVTPRQYESNDQRMQQTPEVYSQVPEDSQVPVEVSHRENLITEPVTSASWELSPYAGCSAEICDSVLQYLLLQEQRLLKYNPFNDGNAFKLSCRRLFVDYICETCAVLKIGKVAQCLAVTLYDLSSAAETKPVDIMKFVHCCINLGAKLEETYYNQPDWPNYTKFVMDTTDVTKFLMRIGFTSDNMPNFNTVVSQITTPHFTFEEYLEAECDLLHFFDFEILFPTPAHFLYILLHEATTELGPVAAKKLRSHCEYITELVIQNHDLMYRFLCHVTALAIFICGRRLGGVQPVYPVSKRIEVDMAPVEFTKFVSAIFELHYVNVNLDRRGSV